MKIFNLDLLVEIKIVDKRESESITFYPFKKSFWGNRKGGFYSLYDRDYPISKEDLESGEYNGTYYIIENNIAYVCPEVTLYFAGKRKITKVFNTYEEALKFGMEQSNSIVGTKQLIIK